MAIEVIGILEGENLTRWRALCVQIEALQLNPTAYSRDETERIVRQRAIMIAEMLALFEVDVAGVIGYEDQ
jgi:hypothetical protein